jgi:alpha-mannosidase
MVCNAHLDPVWLWHWEDGLTETLSTFGIAADFCEKHEDFVFNHNESLLYRWVEEYEPHLFQRIRRLVRKGSWHISGGAYIQPDVNNVSGESHIRHYLVGRKYFQEKFKSYPKTAYNFDPFGHGEGFPQILRGCGMSHYIFCRPGHGTYDLPVGIFRWQDRSGSQVIARRGDDHYLTNNLMLESLDTWLPHYKSEPTTMILWGVGNHGGGATEVEYATLQKYIADHPEYEFVESTPDGFFKEAIAGTKKVPIVRGEIQNSFPGCYTSMSRIKRAHREVESLMSSTERLAALVWWWGYAAYPDENLRVAWKDLLFGEFHDILPGSGTPTAEKDSLQLFAHANEILRRTRFRMHHSMISSDPRTGKGVVPVFVTNPHGFPVKTQVEFELQLDQNHGAIRDPEITLTCEGKKIEMQRLHAEACCAGNWRVRLITLLDLKPWQTLRLEESYRNGKPTRTTMPKITDRSLTFRTKKFKIRINPKTGLVDMLSLPNQSKSLVGKNSLQPVYYADLDHAWTTGDPAKAESMGEHAMLTGYAFGRPSAKFRLATKKEAELLSPIPDDASGAGGGQLSRAIRFVERGALRTVVEVMFVCENSAVVRQYHIGHRDGTLEIRDRVFNSHRDRMLKLLVPLSFDVRDGVGESLYSAANREPTNAHLEMPCQRWAAVRGKQGGGEVFVAVTSTGSGAYSLTEKEWGISVLRSPAYSSFHSIHFDDKLKRRFLPRHDQGEHEMRYSLHIGKRFRETEISRAAQVLNVPPVWQVYYPQPKKIDRKRRVRPTETVVVEDSNIQIVALKKSEKGNKLIVRLQDTLGRRRHISLRVRPYAGRIRTTIDRFGLLTIAVKKGAKRLEWSVVNLVEQVNS